MNIDLAIHWFNSDDDNFAPSCRWCGFQAFGCKTAPAAHHGCEFRATTVAWWQAQAQPEAHRRCIDLHLLHLKRLGNATIQLFLNSKFHSIYVHWHLFLGRTFGRSTMSSGFFRQSAGLWLKDYGLHQELNFNSLYKGIQKSSEFISKILSVYNLIGNCW